MELSKYQEVAKRILEFKEGDFNLDMKWYVSRDGHPISIMGQFNGNVKTTQFCLMGWIAYLDGYPEDHMYTFSNEFDHTGYMYDLVGGVEAEELLIKTEFLFSNRWPNDLAEAKRRAQYVLDHGTYPPTVGRHPGIEFEWD